MSSSNEPPRKKALITGIAGQDGSYLAELLLSKNYEVHGLIRRVALEDPEHRLWRIRHVLDRITLHFGSVESYPSVFKVLHDVRPDECYHLAAQSFVDLSLSDEFTTISTNINGTHFVLAAIKEICPTCRFYFAGSSEMFGNVRIAPQDEETPFRPRSAYGISKVAGFHLTRTFREQYGLIACSGILFNHESPRRGLEYVSRKITNTAAKIKLGMAKNLVLGNIDAKRDWGFAKDYVEGIHLMLQQKQPTDLVIASGQLHSVRDILEISFSHLGLNWQDFVTIDQRLFRPNEEIPLCGNPKQIGLALGWYPRLPFNALIREMIEADFQRLQGVPRIG
jgi:GDPmannose 4,6-dehydratase